jgi:glycosyltransferase involved in cell wall biosynthesis
VTALRVLHVAEPTEYGVAACVADLAVDQAAHGWDVAVLSPIGGRLAEVLRSAGVRHRPWNGRRAVRAVPRDILTVRSVVAAERPDVVHLHSSRAGIAGRLAIRGRVPTLFQPHAWSFFAAGGATGRALGGFERLAARWTNTVVCCSDEERTAAREHRIDARFAVVRNAVDLDHFALATNHAGARAWLGLGEHPIAVCVGRISPQKGQRELIAAWHLVRGEVPNAELILVGDGPDRADLERLAAPGVRFVGHQGDVRPWLAASDVVALLSRYEGLSLAVLEAMATGRSVVVTSAQGMREVVHAGDDGAAGAVVPAGDLPAAARAIIERLRDRDRALREGTLGRALAEANHDKTRWLRTMRELTTDAVEA